MSDYPSECVILARAELENLKAARTNMLSQLRVIEEWIADVETRLQSVRQSDYDTLQERDMDRETLIERLNRP